MTTEYRRGIPSAAHVEAATRLGLLWEDDDTGGQHARWRFEMRNGDLLSDYALRFANYANWAAHLENDTSTSMRAASYRPIRPNGTPVDWGVLDQEVARVGQPATVTSTASAAPTTQPQGFRADLWARLNEWVTANWLNTLGDIRTINDRGISGHSRRYSWDELGLDTTADEADRQALIARWAVYQELKPLYDIVDGVQGEAVMPRDVINQWWLPARNADRARQPIERCTLIRSDTSPRYPQGRGPTCSWYADGADVLDIGLHNFATVLDAVAEARVRVRQGQAAPVPVGTLMMQNPDGTVSPARPGQQPIGRLIETRTVAQPPTPPEPRRFADVRPDRHGWRWWRQTGRDSTDLGQRFETRGGRCRWRSAHADAWFVPDTANPQMLGYTVIPTDEQGNPVSWEAAGFAAEAVRGAQETVRRAADDATPARSVGDIDWTVTGQPVTRDRTVEPATGTVRSTHTARIRQLDRLVTEAIQAGNTGSFSVESPNPPRPGQFSNEPITYESLYLGPNYAVPGIHIAIGTGAKSVQTEAITTLHLPLPRFTADELDDIDHSKTTKLDEAALRRGKLPTVEQIAKYREVRARRTGGTVADALKESRIDCEVAKYVLERWAGGLGDADTVLLLRAAGCIVPLKDTPQHSIRAFDPKQVEVDRRSQDFLRTHNATLDISEKPSSTVQRERQEAEERRQRLAQLRQRLAAERAAQPQEVAKESEASRFDLIEPDPQADPTASIRAWEARQAAAKVRPTAVPPRIAKPAAAPRRPAIEVVDTEVDGLSRVDVVTVLVGRAFNGGC